MYVNYENTRGRSDTSYSDVVKNIESEGNCPFPFCGEDPAEHHKKPIFAEGKYWKATDNAYPYDNVDHHILFIYKEHKLSLTDITTEGWVELHRLVEETIKNRNILGGTLFMRFGDTRYTGASVSHLHAHLVVSKGNSSDYKPVLTRIG